MSQNQHNNDKIAERLLLTRRRAGLSQNEFATRAGVSPRAYRNYELGLREAPLILLIGIHREFGTSFDWLILGDDNPYTEVADLTDALTKAKTYAQRYVERSERQFDENATTKLEARFLSAIIEDADTAEKQIQFMEKFDEI